VSLKIKTLVLFQFPAV